MKVRRDMDLMQMGDRRVLMARGLYEIYVVSPQTGEVVLQEHHVANTEDAAIQKVLRSAKWPEDLDPEDVDILAHPIGYVRDKK